MKRTVAFVALTLMACGASKKTTESNQGEAVETTANAAPEVSTEPYDLQQLSGADQLEPVKEVCPWKPVDDDRIKSMVLGGITELWTEQHLSDHPPRNCQLRVWRSCAPDIDGDGADEAFVRVMWQANTEFGVGIPCEKLKQTEEATERHIVVDHRAILSPAEEWKLRAVTTHSLPGWKRETSRTPEAFVALPNGAIGLRGTYEEAADGAGCRETGVYVRTFDFSQWYPYDSRVRDFSAGEKCR